MSRQLHQKERGQATVEFALLLPLVVCVSFALFEIAIIMTDHFRALEVSRIAVRGASTAPDPGASAAELVHRTLGAKADVATTVDDGLVTVSVSWQHRISLALLSDLLPTVTIRGSSSMLQEPQELFAQN